MKLKVVLALSTALAASPAVANSLGGGSSGNAGPMAGNGNSSALINSGGSSGLAHPRGQDSDSDNPLTDSGNPGAGNGDAGNNADALTEFQGQGGDDGGSGDAEPLADRGEDEPNGNGDSPLAGLQDESAGNDDGDTGEEQESPLDEFLTVENRDDQMIVGARLDGRDRFSEVHEDFVPFATADLVLSPEALSGVLYAEESDDWTRIAGRLSQDRSFLDIEGRGDERVDTETERDAFGLPN